MPTGRNYPKICHCTATCNTLLGLQQRRHHYRLIKDPENITRSTTPSESGESGDAQSGNEAAEGSDSADMDIDNAYDVQMLDDSEAHSGSSSNEDQELADLPTEQDNGQENGNGFYELDLQENHNFDFDDQDEANIFLSLEELEQAIEDDLGPGQNIEMYNLRMSLL